MTLFRPFKRIGCFFGRHRRSKGQAWEVDHERVSLCSYCGIGMRQLPSRGWVVDRKVKEPE